MSTTWGEKAACIGEDPELFFPHGGEHAYAQNDEAKAICRRCPVIRDCLRFALDENIPAGIYGGLTEKERKGLLRAARRRKLDAAGIQARATQALNRQPRTLQSVVAAKTKPLKGGHLAWTGGPQTWCQGEVYTPKQITFAAHHGRRSGERLRASCGIDACVLPQHLIEVPATARCGTASGYQKHLRQNTTPCVPCRRAHNDADTRRRRAAKAVA